MITSLVILILPQDSGLTEQSPSKESKSESHDTWNTKNDTRSDTDSDLSGFAHLSTIGSADLNVSDTKSNRATAFGTVRRLYFQHP